MSDPATGTRSGNSPGAAPLPGEQNPAGVLATAVDRALDGGSVEP
jgi:hypothetical protein